MNDALKIINIEFIAIDVDVLEPEWNESDKNYEGKMTLEKTEFDEKLWRWNKRKVNCLPNI